MTVHCPHCGTGYLLPDHLLGPRGARVRCPNCRRPFVVLREEEAAAVGAMESSPADSASAPPQGGEGVPDGLAEVASSPAAGPSPGAAGDAESTAAEVLENLANRLGSRVTDARARGRVLAELGPELMLAYDEFRARAGADAPREAFRAVLRERWGVDLL